MGSTFTIIIQKMIIYQLFQKDTFAHHHDLLAQMREDYRSWKNLQTQVKTFQQKVSENEAKKQLLQYQVEELDEFALRPNEYLELEEDQRQANGYLNKQNISSNSEQLIQLWRILSLTVQLYQQ